MNPDTGPELSVVIASHERRDLLRRCLESLRTQDAPSGSFEVLVADDGSRDGTAEMAESFEAPFPLRVLRLERGGKPGAVNAAVAAARGEICLFLDDDMIASPGLVAAHLAAHRREPQTLGIGAITQRPIAARDWYARSFAQGWNEHFEERPESTIGWIDCYGANFSAPLGKLREVGGFEDIPTAEDVEMGYRLQRAGCVPTFLPDAHGVHDDQKPGRRMLADQRRQGRVHVELARRVPEMRAQLLPWHESLLPHELRLRRVGIALRLSPRLLAAAGNLMPGSGRRMIWLHVVRRFAFWTSVRRSVSRREWKAIVRGEAT
jgi:glycosyltransferase involved in cell wall biosynthesis